MVVGLHLGNADSDLIQRPGAATADLHGVDVRRDVGGDVPGKNVGGTVEDTADRVVENEQVGAASEVEVGGDLQRRGGHDNPTNFSNGAVPLRCLYFNA